ncbi:carcinoembryonic antigen-related cell adhesion molecule 5 [Lates calcarifer]|uniref:Carcinoembryonic antigen-related cell adhesion molecule 5 n=1 Tax=Lates calcarifer TaxID=8187 RepID=A0A4W6CJP1_LATCA|nr:carcinoembryonic antigen-related cell adhesion molecule 5 [Lates calcarifer]
MDLFRLKSLLFLLFFIGRCRGKVILPEGPLDAVVGKSVTITTLLDKPQYVFIIWNYSDGTDQIHVATVSPTTLKVNAPYEGRVSLNATNGYLTLNSVKTEDSGDYSINVISADGDTKTAEIKLRVLEPVSDVVIKSNLTEAIEHNSTVVLTCSAKGSFLTFTWTNGTAPIVADGKRLTLKNEQTSSTLTIAGVLRSDLVGPICCTAANTLEKEKSAPFNLTVYYGPDEVTIKPPNPPQYIESDSNFNLTCSAPSSPPATYTWYHNKEPMEAAGEVLTLKIIKEHGFGKNVDEYTCRANNAKTKRTIPSPGVSFGVMEPITGAKITGPVATLIAGNSTANLSCQVTTGTVRTRVWLKDGKPLSANSRLVFADDLSSIMINPLQKEDNGVYQCQLNNPVTSIEASYKMVVNYGPEPATVTGESEVELDAKVTLTCSAVSIPPANFTWKFNGTMTAVKTSQYVIDKAVYSNSGTYTCEAHNAVTGKTSKPVTHTLAVKEEIEDGLSDGAIAGIVIGVLLALALAIGLIIYCRQKVPVESPY